MKLTFISKALLSLLGAVLFNVSGFAEKFVILHTNDTHSTIDVMDDGTGGVLQRKAIIDSIRNAEKNVILVDAGDVVQGTLYFKYFHGDVEYPLMDMMSYEIRIPGNHEFDNGVESLAHYYKETQGETLAANYDFTGTELEGVFKPYVIKDIGGKKIGFIGIGLDPASIIAQHNFKGKFLEVIPVVNELAGKLKNEDDCDLVVVVSHLGYNKVNDKTSDIELAQASKDIDIIIGGHTHTLIDPNNSEATPSLFYNAEGKQVRIAQTGKQGKNIGKLTVDLDNLPIKNGDEIGYEIIPVTNRFSENEFDINIVDFLKPYRVAVDSVNNVIIAYSEYELEKTRTGGLANLTADISFQYGMEVVDSLRMVGYSVPDVDLAIMNVGGIRHHMGKGAITEGQILSTYPFSNKFVLISTKGSNIIEAMRISAMKGGEAVSGNVRVIADPKGNLKRVVLNGKEMDPDKDYIVCTIDYVAEGNDDLVSLADHQKLWESNVEVAVPILKWISNQHKLGLKIAPDLGSRFVVDVADQIVED